MVFTVHVCIYATLPCIFYISYCIVCGLSTPSSGLQIARRELAMQRVDLFGIRIRAYGAQNRGVILDRRLLQGDRKRRLL